ncbi:MAG TPA: hypothetical protein VKU41_32185 [Polyangiaceae bacterium]|nr:hypothetical protein [Polyangiaceae bacterium]
MSPSVALLLAQTFAHGAWGVAFSPPDPARDRPAIVFLHGMWAGPEEACPPLRNAALPFGFLVCPRANTPFGDGGTMWTGTSVEAARSIGVALDAVAAAGGGASLRRDRDGTLVGYSNGAYFAAEVAGAERGRWPGLVLLSMKLDLDPARLRAAGVRRVALAAGDADDTRTSMDAQAKRLNDAGLEARFASLGPGGHPLPADIGPRLCALIAWVRRDDAARCPG